MPSLNFQTYTKAAGAREQRLLHMGYEPESPSANRQGLMDDGG
jgi:hypothetical protein